MRSRAAEAVPEPEAEGDVTESRRRLQTVTWSMILIDFDGFLERFSAEVLLKASESGTWEKVLQSVYKRSDRCSGRCREAPKGRQEVEEMPLEVAHSRVAELEMEKEELHREVERLRLQLRELLGASWRMLKALRKRVF